MPKKQLTIFKSGVRQVSFSTVDKLWAKRMVYGECGKNPTSFETYAILWTITVRYLCHKSRHRWPKTFWKMMRAFSQPINPKWLYNGSLAKKARAAGKESGSRMRCNRRAKMCAMTDFPQDIEDYVEDFAKNGPTDLSRRGTYYSDLFDSNPSNWAASWVKGLKKRQPHGREIGGNWFFQDKNRLEGLPVKVQKINTMKVAYVAGPYRADTPYELEQNVRVAENVALGLANIGYATFCPHTQSRFFYGQLTEDFWIQATLELLSRCDLVVLCKGWKKSKGTLGEIEMAKTLGIPIYTTVMLYGEVFDLEELSD